MAWLTLNGGDLLSILTQQERDLFGQGDSASNSPDRLVAILKWVTAQIRGKVAACAANRDLMGPVNTVPEELYGDGIVIARFQLLTSLPTPGRAFQDESRLRAYSDALKHLDDAAACTIAIEPPLPGDLYEADSSAFGSRDDALADPVLSRNRNVIDFGFWK